MNEPATQTVIKENARSVRNRSLPPISSENLCNGSGSILLFYQYIEPEWTNKEHSQVLKKVIEIASTHKITGRGRVAQEGLNCTLTSKHPQHIRDFCYGLRKYKPIFEETDFKITDGISKDKLFKSLSIRKTTELVAYDLNVGKEKAPSLKEYGGVHLDADEYHEAMKDPETVVIDVRNQYETLIGSFNPPENGATKIDPQMRNSCEFKRWLNQKETLDKLNNKKVLMYCTGGIRCERATALLNKITAVKNETSEDEFKPKGVYHLQGGIERYVKTYPEGGFWKGKNYLFDRRMEQTPCALSSDQQANKSTQEEEENVNAKCCLCRKKWSVYRGQFKCNRSLCRVPVIVCETCQNKATKCPEKLICELCRVGFRLSKNNEPKEDDALKSRKRKTADSTSENQVTETQQQQQAPVKKDYYDDRLFLRRLPLTSTYTKVKNALQESLSLSSPDDTDNDKVLALKWLTNDKGCFYGSCIVIFSDRKYVEEVLETISTGKNEKNKTPKAKIARVAKGQIRIDNKKIKISKVFMKDGEKEKKEQVPFCNDKDYLQKEYPPIGAC